MGNLNSVIVLILLAFVAQMVQADDATIRKSLAQFPRSITPESINPTPIEGLFEITVGAGVFYMTGDGKYLIQGNILDVFAKTDLTDLKMSEIRAEQIETIIDAETVIFSPKDVKHKIYVFTDIDCGYCQKLHDEIDQFMALGIKVQYLLFPRAGAGSSSYDKAVTVWCSDDKAKALTQSKKGIPLDKITCDNPVSKHIALGRVLGLSGTPMMVTEYGTIYPGYVPAQELLERLKNAKRSAKN